MEIRWFGNSTGVCGDERTSGTGVEIWALCRLQGLSPQPMEYLELYVRFKDCIHIDLVRRTRRALREKLGLTSLSIRNYLASATPFYNNHSGAVREGSRVRIRGQRGTKRGLT